jgi:hypothetical protein
MTGKRKHASLGRLELTPLMGTLLLFLACGSVDGVDVDAAGGAGGRGGAAGDVGGRGGALTGGAGGDAGGRGGAAGDVGQGGAAAGTGGAAGGAGGSGGACGSTSVCYACSTLRVACTSPNPSAGPWVCCTQAGLISCDTNKCGVF